ncbi:hypothetical protein K2173_012346 [Erythroxylum novogranatense]|uniref:Uncharacterized protein n=1 Tax=Erythroxylum novogranatense TaxID=1862640 RepID=A0AAV8SCM8_9ROSI|nr:hypothetical protein K2173_012346 [Erythroxylum novogranatense]
MKLHTAGSTLRDSQRKKLLVLLSYRYVLIQPLLLITRALNFPMAKDMSKHIIEIGSNCESTPQKRRLRSNSTSLQDAPICTPKQGKSPRSCFNSSPGTPLKGKNGDSDERPESRCQLPVMKLSSDFKIKPDWQPNDVEHLGAVKAALHVSTAPSTVLCCEDEQKKVFDFCKNCIEQGKAGSLYLCGLPGTGKSLSMEKVKQHLLNWSKESGCLPPDMVALNCTSLTKT